MVVGSIWLRLNSACYLGSVSIAVFLMNNPYEGKFRLGLMIAILKLLKWIGGSLPPPLA
jgi:hypothetical protein